MTKRKITLKGWYSQATLGGSFKVFRGYENLKCLASISVPFYYKENTKVGYQREIIESHAKDLKFFFEEQSYRFIPEIILGVRLVLAEKIIYLNAGFTLEEKMEFFTNEGSYSDSYDISRADKPELHLGKQAKMTIDMEKLEKAKDTIRRIDGNHRLYFAQELVDDPNNPNKYVVPYCMVLLGPTSNKWDDFAEATIFYNINQKGIPITSEHGFNVLLTADHDERSMFAQDPLLFCAQYLKQELQNCSSELQGIFGNLPLTNLHAISKILKDQNLIEFEDRESVKRSLKELIIEINEHFCWALIENLEITRTFKIVPAILLILLDSDKKNSASHWLRSYNKWIISNHLLEEFESVNPAEIWSIFRKWKENQPKNIFVSCSFRDTEELNAMKRMIMEAIDIIKQRHPDIKIEQVRIDESKGEAFELPAEIFSQIDNSDLLIADLTDERPNVYCEVGYAKAKGMPFFLCFRAKNEEIQKAANKIHLDLQPYRYIPYSDASILRDELVNELEAFYVVN